MRLKKQTALLVTAACCGLVAGTARATVLFSDNFDGPSATDINGLAPDVAPGAETWVAAYQFDADGVIEDGNDIYGGSATLAFTPAQGFTYTLDASFRNFASTANTAAVDSDWVALGFANGQSELDSSNARFTAGLVKGVAWMLMRGDTSAANPNFTWLGNDSTGTASGTNVQWAALDTSFGADMDMRIVLDTTGGEGTWTATYYAKLAADANYVEVRSATLLLDEAGINSVGISRSNQGFTGQVTSFSLEVSGGVAIPGDTDGDGDVDDSDLGTSFANYTGPVGDVGKTAAQGDTDGDGDVDDSDLGTSFSGYTGPLGPASVPEPASFALLGLGALTMMRRRG